MRIVFVYSPFATLLPSSKFRSLHDECPSVRSENIQFRGISSRLFNRTQIVLVKFILATHEKFLGKKHKLISVVFVKVTKHIPRRWIFCCPNYIVGISNEPSHKEAFTENLRQSGTRDLGVEIANGGLTTRT